MKVSGSILSSTIKPKEVIELFNKTNLDYIHIDLMDGKFVGNKTYTMSDIVKFSSLSKKPMDVHLMVNNPEKYIEEAEKYTKLFSSSFLFKFPSNKELN